MKAIPNYQSSAFIVPGDALTHITYASKEDLAVLMYVLYKDEFTVTNAAEELSLSESVFIDSLKFWEERNVFSTGSAKKENSARKTAERKAVRPSKKTVLRSSLPSYTTEETAAFLEDNLGTAELIDNCEGIIGKIFTTAETNIIIGLLDHLSLSGDYILLLFAHAAKIEKKSVRYIEKLALGFVDRDITSYSALEAELSKIEIANSMMGKIRTLFGIGSRAFSEKEKTMISKWCNEWNFSFEIIEKAYEITVNNTGDASLSYTNAILDNWHNANLTSADEIDSYITANPKNYDKGKAKHKKGVATPLSVSSFDTDDFFEAALKRSYGE